MSDHPEQAESSEATDFLMMYELNNKICPANGVISFGNDNEFGCSIQIENNEENPPSGEVPWL